MNPDVPKSRAAPESVIAARDIGITAYQNWCAIPARSGYVSGWRDPD